MHRARLPIAQPCSERFEAMNGAGSERFCDKCSTPVHDLSQMTRIEAESFLARHGGRKVCVRYRSDADGNLRFRPAPTPPPSRVLAVATLALAACTGYVESETIESPEDAIACEDADGYTIPCDDAVDPSAEGATDERPSATTIERDAIDEAEVPVLGQVSVPVEVVHSDEADGQPAAEGCPVPLPETEPLEVMMGEMIAPPTSRREQRRAERKWKREQRREARADRRSGRA